MKHDGRVYPCCQSYCARRRAGRRFARTESLQEIFNSEEMRRLRRLHAAGRGAEMDMCARCSTPIPHPALAAASLLLHGKWVRRALPLVERLIRGAQASGAAPLAARSELVQIQKQSNEYERAGYDEEAKGHLLARTGRILPCPVGRPGGKSHGKTGAKHTRSIF